MGGDVVSLHNTKAFLMTPLSFVPHCLFIFDGSSLNYLEVLFSIYPKKSVVFMFVLS